MKIDKNKLVYDIDQIKKRLDYTTHFLVLDDYNKSSEQLISGYIEYHNLIKRFKEYINKVNIKQ